MLGTAEGQARIPTVALSGGWRTILEPPARRELEQTVLPAFLSRQRWFGGKGRHVHSMRLTDWRAFPDEDGRVFLALLEVRFTEGEPELYFCPLGVTDGDAAEKIASDGHGKVMARLTGPEGEAMLHDGLADDSICTALLESIGGSGEFATRLGRIRGLPTAAYAPLRGEGALPVERGPATSSNTLVFYGRRLLLKLFRRLEPGINPDLEIGRFLTEKTSFDRIPRVAGSIAYHRPNSEPINLAILQARVENQSDGWHHTVEEVRHYFPRISRLLSASESLASDPRPLLELAEAEPPPAVAEAIGEYLPSAATLGRRTAEMHLALAADARNPDFAPEPFDPRDAAALRQSIREEAEQAIAALRDRVSHLPRETAAPARHLLETGSETLKRRAREKQFDGGAAKIRCHGDYHLGQVLRVAGDYVILDFEGEPARSVAERRGKQSPLKDVAGMVRSYHYAAHTGRFAFASNEPNDSSRLEALAELWFQWVSAAFLRAYRAAAHGATFLPRDPTHFAALLDAFMLDKAFYELNYELNNRPDWVRIPLRGILALLETSSPGG